MVDHIDPFSKGGADEMVNYITACQSCNAGKSDSVLSDTTTLQKQKAQLEAKNARNWTEFRNWLYDVMGDANV